MLPTARSWRFSIESFAGALLPNSALWSIERGHSFRALKLLSSVFLTTGTPWDHHAINAIGWIIDWSLCCVRVLLCEWLRTVTSSNEQSAQDLYCFPIIKKESTSDWRKDIIFRRFDQAPLGRSGRHSEIKKIKKWKEQNHMRHWGATEQSS